jgi:2-C-methyl-D-erythritol 4-phosphate cytidylyltransferase
MFRLRPLTDALTAALNAGKLVTDDASSMELAGYRPKMVKGRADNIKITQPGDLQLAELYLQEQAT